ncbi:MAG: tRNA (N(6)-L-threonylcarbamoyladenosine(37)-C(2))-methylthiotransferase MtaB [Oscillospiraceae bacterium]|nr:tRNA (N(6)-L-threonylcarbamoyladenosine(37)-C(2))-methylthiotransferase MtaB [Oscillospiraceae bacterium]MDD3833095.1 tRNA (N(6)-L-threonylcarbamoyladenosine(37)-C(2))-methylthiotransferase MtaB [Oscillospiraceae bacterium]
MNALFHTLGCKVNQYETQAMRRLMEDEGWNTAEYTQESQVSDQELVIVINSCTVTGESDRKLGQLLRRLRRNHPHAILVLTGCMPQAFPEIADRFTQADIVLGNAARHALPSRINRFLTLRQRIVDISEHNEQFESLSIDEFQGRTRAFIKIEDGCDRFCSYCIIPYARGRVRSKQPDELKSELEKLAANEYSEIVLVGINLTAYGKEWGGSLCEAAEIASSIPGIHRVRLGSLEPDLMTPETINRLAALDKLCPQFHLSLQSGCGATLKRMNRHYSPEEYKEVCRDLREKFPDCGITTDVMVGFPGEDEDEFVQSLNFVESIGFSRVHIFAYSPRPGTPAAKAQNQVSGAEKAKRSRRMSAVCNKSRDKYLDGWIGRCTEVLLEARMDDNAIEGYTPQYFPVRITDHDGKLTPGLTVTAEITGHQNGICMGEISSKFN